MTTQNTIIWWIRRDLRLSDNPVLDAIAADGAAVLPVYICDPIDESLGAAPQFRLGLGLEYLQSQLAARGLRLIIRRGPALPVLQQLIETSGARGVFWSRLYDPDAVKRDSEVKASLRSQGIAARPFGGRLLFEPWTVEKKSGGFFQVYTPFWRVVSAIPVAPPSPEPGSLRGPKVWPASDSIADLEFDRRMGRGADIVAEHCRVGEVRALERAQQFVAENLQGYAEKRDFPASYATSELSENLAWGEISPRQIWALTEACKASSAVEKFRKELVWREFSYHLMHHTSHILNQNWRPGWDSFPWSDGEGDTLLRWQQGRTGYDLIDAGMRELYVTGKMHNRVRMVAASFLCKHMMIHWKAGMNWFRDCLVDWDPAANAMGWQWVAGCGPDAAPFFRIFNPEGQRQKFDADGSYCRKWIAEGQLAAPDTALAFFKACPQHWGLSDRDLRADRMVDLAEGRARALAAYEALKHTGEKQQA